MKRYQGARGLEFAENRREVSSLLYLSSHLAFYRLISLASVGLSVCVDSYYGRPDGWYSDAWVGVGVRKDDYAISRYDQFWGWNTYPKPDEEKNIKAVDGKILHDEIKDKDDAVQIDGDKERLDIKDVKGKTTEKEDDEEKYLYYPCKYTNEEDCVRHFLSTNGHCVPVHKYNQKESIYREKSVLYFPRFNFTVTMTDMKIEGLHGKLDKFYINKKTGNLIYSVDFKAISVDSKISYFEFHRQGQEPVRAADFAKVTYAPTILTAVIPFNYFSLSLKHSRINAYISGNPDYLIGPKVTNNPDPVIQKTVAAYTVDVPTAVQEIFLTESYNFFIAYLQNYICDFGINE